MRKSFISLLLLVVVLIATQAAQAVKIADITQINTFITDVALPARLAEICRTHGIEVIEALPESLQADEADAEPRSSVG